MSMLSTCILQSLWIKYDDLVGVGMNKRGTTKFIFHIRQNDIRSADFRSFLHTKMTRTFLPEPREPFAGCERVAMTFDMTFYMTLDTTFDRMMIMIMSWFPDLGVLGDDRGCTATTAGPTEPRVTVTTTYQWQQLTQFVSNESNHHVQIILTL